VAPGRCSTRTDPLFTVLLAFVVGGGSQLQAMGDAMSSITKSGCLQDYRLLVYRRALHPELFPVRDRRSVVHMDYEFEAWVMPGSHLMRFLHKGTCATELITAEDQEFPTRGLVTDLPCAGERDHEEAFGDDVRYVSTIQTEQLPETLYRDTYNELTEFGRENEALIFEWKDADGGRCASILDLQRYRREVHAQTYHMLSQGGVVIRTQAIFEHLAGKKSA